MPVQWDWFCTPLFLEFICAFIGGGPAKVKPGEAVVASIFQHAPVKEHVGADMAVFSKCRCPRVFQNAFEMDDQAAGHGLIIAVDHKNSRMICEFLKHVSHELDRMDRRAKISHVYRKNVVEIVQQFTPTDFNGQALFRRLLDLASEF